MRSNIDKELIQYHAKYAADSEFSRKARLQQSKWRELKGYPIGKTPRGDTPMGNFIEKLFAHEQKVNLLTENIRQIALDELASSKSTGALIQENRLWENTLSSQPLCFNLFGEMHYDLNLATDFFKESFPDRAIFRVTAVRFEYSPSRGEKALTGDHSAFDAFVEYVAESGNKGFIGIEVKYAESLMEGRDSIKRTFAMHKEEYLRVSAGAYDASGNGARTIFDMDSIEEMAQAPKFQIWRDHLLALSMLQADLYDEGFFLFLYPYQNAECREGFHEYKDSLAIKSEDAAKRCYLYEGDIFEYIQRLHDMAGQPWSQELVERYTWRNED